jgi:hypothetical protein
MRIAMNFDGYNKRRYSAPWIGRIIEWETGKKPVMNWGRYIGDDDGGEVEIEATPGDIVRIGQKDYRGNNTTADWYEVLEHGLLNEVSATKARELFLNHKESLNK